MMPSDPTIDLKRSTAIAMTLFLLFSSLIIFQGVEGVDQSHQKEWPGIITLRGSMDLDDIPFYFPYMPGDMMSDYHIVQFDGPIMEEDKIMLRQAGFTILDYLPEYSFVVKDGGDGFRELDGNELRHIPLPSFMKISPIIYEVVNTGNLGEYFDTMVVETFIPSQDAYLSLLSMGDVEPISLTRYHVRSMDFLKIASITDVKWVEPLPEYKLTNNVASGIIDVDTIRSLYGLDGTGETVAIADTGLDTGVDDHSIVGDIHADFDGRAILRNWAGSSPDDGHGHGTHVAGSVGGDGSSSSGSIQGMATNATIVFQAIATDTGGLNTPGNLSTMFKQAYDLGARVHTNSWGSDGSWFWGRYIQSCYDVDWSMFHYPDQLILFAAGNEGTDSSPSDGKVDAGAVSPPATAKSSLSVGASENVRSSGGIQATWGQGWGPDFPNNPIRNDHVSNNEDGLAGFSSRGPTLDNRLKPEVVAPGTNILSTKSSLPGLTVGNGWGAYNLDYIYMGGTSMSTPITAGMATLVRQYFNQTMGEDQILASLIKATIINGAIDMTPGQYGSSNPTTKEINSRPDNDQGWGRINLEGSLYPEVGAFTYENNWDGIVTGQNFTRVFRVNSNEELRVTLAWSDYPGSYFAGKQLINDLDLVLIAPDGSEYFGNDLVAPYNDTKDDINPTETISLADPSMGWWKVEVRGANIPLGPQHFALVSSGNISEYITNSMIFDRQYYSTDDASINIQLTAKDLIGTGSIEVNLTSASDPIGMKVNLIEEGEFGSFMGTIRTSNVSTLDPGKLYVEPEDTIYAWYSNTQHGFFFDANARAKEPVRAALWHLPENHLVYSLGDVVTLKGVSLPGTDVKWTIENSTLGYMELDDTGSISLGDDVAGDGNYSSLLYISEEMYLRGNIILRVHDPFLGYIYYREFPLEINTSTARAPTDLITEPVPEGNGVQISWKKTGGSKLDHHSIFVNRTPLNLSYDPDNWLFVFDTGHSGNTTEVLDLEDGVEYYFRVASVWENGNTSSPSHWALGIPQDSVAPEVEITEDPYTLAGDSEILFEADDDLEMLEVEYYNDTNKDGIANDNGTWLPAGTADGKDFKWDTREEADGPGNMERMILRARGSDEVPNVSNWTEFPGYSVDNIGPAVLEFDWFPGRITNTGYYSNLLGTTEPMSTIDLIVNDRVQNTTTAGQSGLFGLSLTLDEGYNLVNLSGYDMHGAGPTLISYEFTLDTAAPVIGLEEFNRTLEVGSGIRQFNSTSYDVGIDPQYRMIANTTWEMILPSGQHRVGYGDSYSVVLDSLGNHSILLWIKDMAGNVNNTRTDFVVVDTLVPRIKVIGNWIVNEDTSVEYSSEGTFDNDPCTLDGKCSQYNWSFSGPGNWTYTSERWETTVIFPDPGSYEGSLTVWDPTGNSANELFDITVLDITPPDGTIIGPKKVKVGETFNLSALFEDNGPLFREEGEYTWVINFIDDYGLSFKWGEDNGTFVSYSMLDQGNYTFDITVTDTSGNARKASHKVWVWDPPVIVEEKELSKEERSWLLIVAIAVGVLIILLISALVIWKVTREELHDVDWADEDEDLDELDKIDIDEEFEDEEDDFEEMDEW